MLHFTSFLHSFSSLAREKKIHCTQKPLLYIISKQHSSKQGQVYPKLNSVKKVFRVEGKSLIWHLHSIIREHSVLPPFAKKNTVIVVCCQSDFVIWWTLPFYSEKLFFEQNFLYWLLWICFPGWFWQDIFEVFIIGLIRFLETNYFIKNSHCVTV